VSIGEYPHLEPGESFTTPAYRVQTVVGSMQGSYHFSDDGTVVWSTCRPFHSIRPNKGTEKEIMATYVIVTYKAALTPLMQLLEHIQYRADPRQNFGCCDLINRGPESLENAYALSSLIATIRKWYGQPWSAFILAVSFMSLRN